MSFPLTGAQATDMKRVNIPKGTLRITLANTSQFVVTALFYVVVTKTNALTQTDIGILSILTFLAQAFSLLTMIALPMALTKFASEKLGKNQKEEAAATQKIVTKTVVIVSIAGFAVSVLLSQLISQQLWNNSEYMIIIILNFIFALITNIKDLCNSTLQALYLFGQMATITITFMVSSRAIAILLALLDMGVMGVTVGYISGSMIAVAISIHFLRRKLPKTTKTAPLKPLLSYSFPLFISSLTVLVLNWADIVIITSLIGDLTLTGIYSIVVNSVSALSILYLPVTTTIFPALSTHYGLEKTQNSSLILEITSRYIAYILVPSCVGLAIVAPTALNLFYGPDYVKGAIPMAVLSITTLLIALLAIFTTTFQAIGKTGQILKINIIASILLILTLLSLVPLLNVTGAALARLITKTIALSLAIYILKKEIKIHLDKEAFWKSTVSTMATIPFLLTIQLILSTNLSTIQTLALELLIAVVIYTFSLHALKALKSQDFQLLKQAFPKSLTKFLNIIERILVR